MKNRSITLNGVELKRVFDIQCNLEDQVWVIRMYYDKRIGEVTDLKQLSDFVYHNNVPPEDLASITLFVPFDNTQIEITHPNKLNKL